MESTLRSSASRIRFRALERVPFPEAVGPTMARRLGEGFMFIQNIRAVPVLNE